MAEPRLSGRLYPTNCREIRWARRTSLSGGPRVKIQKAREKIW
jgi:hypothetical protein